MNLGDIVTAICDIGGQNDDTTKAILRRAVNRRYKKVCDSFPWRDLEQTALASVGTGGIIDLPQHMDRVVSIRSDGDTFLDPVSVSELTQIDPEIFERSGKPIYYREYFDGSSRRIEVFPKPAEDVPLFIAGKRTPDDLVNDVDTPIVRGISNVLVAYGYHDMLRRQRQAEKAKEVLAEAVGLETAAQNLETQQANQPRQIKQLTANGNSLAELCDQVSATTGQWSPDAKILIKYFLRSNYLAIWDMFNWPEATVCAKVNTDGATIVLPVYFDRIIQVRCNSVFSPLMNVEASLVFGITPQVFEQTGISWGFSYLTSVGVAILPPTREKLAFASTDMNDTGNVFVMGELEGSMLSENVSLNGLAQVQTVNQYDTPLTVSKAMTAGDVIVTGQTTGTQLERLLADENEHRHMRIWLHPEPLTAQVALILGKRTMTPFAADEDTPLLRDIGAALIAGASSDMFAKIGNDKASADQRQQANAAIKVLVDLQTQQGAFTTQVTPYVESSYTGLELTRLGWI